MQSVRKGIKRALGYGDISSESDSDDEFPRYNPADDPEAIARSLLPPRARSPTQIETAHMERRRVLKARRRERKAQQAEVVMVRHNDEIDAMIQNINTALGTNVDMVDPRIRFVIGQIVNAHGLTLHSLSLMRRSRILLSAIGDIAGARLVNAGQVIYSAGQAVLAALRGAGSLASRGVSFVTSGLPRWGANAVAFLPSRLYSLGPSVSGQGAMPPSSFSQVVFHPQPVASRQVAADELLAQHLVGNVGAQRAAFQDFENARARGPYSQAPLLASTSAPAPAPSPAPAPAVEEDECSICMEPARDNAVLTRCNHKFHSACINMWLSTHRTCPMCRYINPTPLVHAPPKRQRQGGGGGSRKTRSKSKSKTRRLRKSRKPCKSYKSRKPRSSSRRK
jgi:hypothetical protein